MYKMEQAIDTKILDCQNLYYSFLGLLVDKTITKTFAAGVHSDSITK